MKNRILALILGGTMLAAGALAFAGCGHKHTFTTSYQLADCDTEGYTRHTCTTCGYVYADEFIEPYGHALNYSLHVIYPSDTLQAASRTTTLSSPHYELNVTFTEEQLKELKDMGADICIHKECGFCDYVTPEGDHLLSPYELFEMDWFSNPTFVQQMVDKGNGYVNHIIVPPYYRDESGELIPRTVIEEEVLSVTVAGEHVITMPDTIETIEDNAFNIAGVARISLSKNLKSIGFHAFGLVEIPWIVIPKSVQFIDNFAFGPCEKMKAILYEGTVNDWVNVTIMDDSYSHRDNPLKKVPVYFYSETKPANANSYFKSWRYVEGEPAIWQ